MYTIIVYDVYPVTQGLPEHATTMIEKDTGIKRRPLTTEQEVSLQEPVLKALEDYFAAAYESDSPLGSVGTIASSGDDMVLCYNAFRVPEHLAPVVLEFMAKHGELLHGVIRRGESEPTH